MTNNKRRLRYQDEIKNFTNANISITKYVKVQTALTKSKSSFSTVSTENSFPANLLGKIDDASRSESFLMQT